MWPQILKHKKILEQETGYIKKDWGGKISVALVFPNTYRVGMGNLAIHTIYKLLNDDPRIVCERAFLPDKEDKTVLSLESQRPLTDFDIVAFSISFQNDFLNILPILSLAKIEPRSANRGQVSTFHNTKTGTTHNTRSSSYPLLLAGGVAVTMNHKPLVEIFDRFFLGEAEESLVNTINGLLRRTRLPAGRQAPRNDTKKHYVKNLNKYPTQTVIYSKLAEFGDMHLIEMSRGCPRNCKYCATPCLYAPFRTRNLKTITQMIEQGLRQRKKIGLISGDLIAHRNFYSIAELIHKKGGTFSPSSLRVESINDKLVTLLAETGQKSISLGIEAANENLRVSLGKTFSNQELFKKIELLKKTKLNNLRLYFMIGLPQETFEDIEAIASLSKQIKKIIKNTSLTLTIAHFVPKPGTFFAKEKYAGEKYLKDADKTLKRLLGKTKGISIHTDSVLSSTCDYVLSNGDGSLITFLEMAEKEGLRKALKVIARS